MELGELLIGEEVLGDIKLTMYQVHCPHTGPTGGGKCVNEPYEEGYFTTDEALFGRPAGQNFICDPALATD